MAETSGGEDRRPRLEAVYLRPCPALVGRHLVEAVGKLGLSPLSPDPLGRDVTTLDR